MTGIAGSSKLCQFMRAQEQDEMGVYVRVHAVDSNVVVDVESEKVANPTNWLVGKAFRRPRKSRRNGSYVFARQSATVLVAR